jgi:hypothetical protein
MTHALTYNNKLLVNIKSALLKGTVSRDYLYSIFFINHILLVLLEVLNEDFKF